MGSKAEGPQAQGPQRLYELLDPAFHRFTYKLHIIDMDIDHNQGKDINRRILHSVSKAQTSWIPETMVRRILSLLWSFGSLNQAEHIFLAVFCANSAEVFRIRTCPGRQVRIAHGKRGSRLCRYGYDVTGCTCEPYATPD